MRPLDVPEGYELAQHGGPYARELGPLWVKREEGRVTLAMRVEERHCNSAKAAHGGCIASLADLGLVHTASALRAQQGLPRQFLVTVSLNVEFLAPAPEGSWLELVGEASRIGRTLCFTDGVMWADGKKVARCSGVFALGAARPG
ncbi:PaaI family thioesterase [Siccirubricoccus phaeus]|uniref:PaaI family thioesterase n=1 Tax=Siccirubricoccus phaeus TaxID=2595053 RepID=UPI00165AE111|nr:PaaI family thioesterase [Siccirubricoccus phaeus]